jgi:hypothetical protein
MILLFYEMPVPSQDHYGFHSFPVVDGFCLFIYTYEFGLSLWKIVRSSVILLLPLFRTDHLKVKGPMNLFRSKQVFESSVVYNDKVY